MQVLWAPIALRQVEQIFDYLEQFNPRAAEAVAVALITAGNSLKTFPHRGRPVAKTNKREIIAIYPYLIRYRIIGNTVRILRVRHTARRPTKP